MKRAVIGWALVVLVGSSVALLGCFDLGSDETDSSKSVTVEAVRRDLRVTVPAKGYLEAVKASPIAVPRVPTGGLKVKELVPEGSIVKEGEIVVVFDDAQLNVDLDNHKASFRSANRRIDGNDLQSNIESGSIEVMREVAALERDNAVEFQILDESIYSRQEILETEVKRDNAEETILFADASLLLRGEYYDIEERILGVEKEQAKGKMDRIQTSLANLVLKAPLGGLLVYKKNWRGSSVAVGDTIWPGNVIMSIVDPSQTSLTSFVLEKDAAGIQPDCVAEVRIDARPDRVFKGKVTTVAEISRPIERGSPVKYFEVKIALEDGDPNLLKPGMKGEARVQAGLIEDAVVVPRSVVRGEADAPFVVVARSTGQERRPVKLGLGDQVRISIAEGLEGGERIVLGGKEPDPLPADALESASAGVSAGAGGK